MDKLPFPASVRTLAMTLLLVGFLPRLEASLLVSVDFERDLDPHPYSGVEASAASANSLFGAANIWNILTVPLTPATDPSFTNLVDSTGAASAVDMAITGTVGGLDKSFLTDDLTGDYIFFNDGPPTSVSIDFVLSDLTSSGEYTFYTYTSDFSSGSYDITVDTNGDGNLGDETAVTVTNLADGYFSSVFADSSGQIIGRLDPTGALTTHWAGFQLAEVVPEPGGVFLLLVSGMAAIAVRKRKNLWSSGIEK